MTEDAVTEATVKLRESRPKTFPGLLDMVFEYIVFYRWIYFKNRPRGNLLLLRALLSVSFFFAIYFQFFGNIRLVLSGIEIDPAILWLVCVVGGYWNMLSVFHQKSAHCSRIYQEILKEVGRKNDRGAKLLSSALARELLTLDLWAHRSYSWFLRGVIDEAIMTQQPGDRAQFYSRMNKGDVAISELRALIEGYERGLLQTARANAA